MTAPYFSDMLGPFPDVLWEPSFLTPAEHDEAFSFCQGLPWSVPNLHIGGRTVPTPREILWYGDVPYTYSGLKHVARALPKPLADMAARIDAYLAEQGVSASFNSVLMNRYRNGADSIGMHSDDETQLGSQPVIASVSLGATRTFIFAHKSTGTRHKEPLTPGSLLVMKGTCQDEWRHGIPKEANAGERINLTFRRTLA